MTEFILVTVLLFLAVAPLAIVVLRPSTYKGKKLALIANIASVFAVCLLVTGFGITSAVSAETTAQTAAGGLSTGNGLAFLAAALATAGSCIGGGIAVAGAASAALGAISENEKIFGKSLIMVVLAEGIAIYGMLISILILGKL